MPRTALLLGAAQGTTFTNSFVSFPLCCPSRATFLTGQYMHNHGVDGNGPPPNGGYASLDHTNTLPVWLQPAGYATGHVGKYLNGYGVDDPNRGPPGWTEWYGLLDGGTYRTYDYIMNRNGAVKRFGTRPSDYQTDVIADDAVDFIDRRAPAAAPFFLTVAPIAPHREFTSGTTTAPIEPAPRHQGRYDERRAPTASVVQRGRRGRQAGPHPEPAEAERGPGRRDHRRAYRHEAAVAARGGRDGRAHPRRVAGERRAPEHRDRVHLGQRLLPRRAPHRDGEVEGLRGGGPGAAPRRRDRASPPGP